ncbi:MAG: PEGA domain-containing protein [Verrucomicrobia bacterium]|nr:PEGA domain-containing protein [Verrucomicrobiota bacterium]
MEHTKIILPPPKRPGDARKGKFSNSAISGWVVAALLLGLLIGVLIGERRASSGSGDEKQQQVSQVAEVINPDVMKRLAEARVAMAAGQWVEARKLYLGVLAIQSDQPEAKITLPLIDRYIDNAQGRVLVKTKPPGASVKLGKQGAKKSPAVFEEVPIGSYVIEVSKEGYEKMEHKIVVRDDRTEDVGVLELAPQAGSLSVSSEPKGVSFEIVAADGEKSSSGKTPVTLEKLPPGDYSVTLKMEGWPNFSEKVKIAHNRKASVSHVFSQGGLQVISDPSGAEVWLKAQGKGKSKLAGSTPLNVPGLVVGQYELVIRYQDWPEIRRVVEIEEGENRPLEFAWKRGLMNFTSDPPGAEVFLNDKRIGRGGEKTPLQWELPEGDYHFVARRKGLADVVVDTEMDVANNKRVVFDFEY